MLPEWLDAAANENAAAAKLRHLRGRDGAWGELIAAAQAIIGVYQDFPGNVSTLYDENAAIDLIAAARIMDSASQAAEINETERMDLALLATVAFGMHGNSLSAFAVAQRVLASNPDKSPSLAAILATAAPRTLGVVQEWCSEGSAEREYLELLGSYLEPVMHFGVSVVRAGAR
jgi:hypothetical protein